jgi:hypothetical protein
MGIKFCRPDHDPAFGLIDSDYLTTVLYSHPKAATMSKQPNLEQLEDSLLNAKSKAKRIKAGDALRELGQDASPAVPTLIRALDDPDSTVRRASIRALASIGKAAKPAIPKLFKNVMFDEFSYLSSKAIVFTRQPGMEFLLKEFNSQDSVRAVAAAYCLCTYTYHQDDINCPEMPDKVFLAVKDKINDSSSQTLHRAATFVLATLLCNPAIGCRKDLDLQQINSQMLDLLSQPNLDLACTACVAMGRMREFALPSIFSLIHAVFEDLWWAPYAIETLKNLDESITESGNDLFSYDEAANALGDYSAEDFRKHFEGYSQCYSMHEMKKRALDAGIIHETKPSAKGIDVLGVHRVRAKEPCFLIEIIVRESTGCFDVGKIAQKTTNPPSHQVAYDERILNADGRHELSETCLDWPDRSDDYRWIGDIRITFFLHYLDLEKPLETPFGSVELPDSTPRPSRLRFIKYQSP